MRRSQTSDKGNVSEAKVLAAYTQAGFDVYLPFGSGASCDLIVDTGVRLLKVQVKTGRLRDGCVLFAAQRINGHHGTKRYKYEADELDYFAVYCPDNDRVYVVPLLGELTEVRLRIAATKNQQQQHIRWAETYEFQQHLEELRKGVELVGLEPTASAMPLQRSSN